MNFEELDAYLLSKNGATFDYPFDEVVRVYRIGNKMFALVVDEQPLAINLKCDPMYALELRSLFRCVTGGYHMNKKHWNTVICDDEIDESMLFGWIDDSYDLVFHSLSKKMQSFIRNA